MSILISRPLLSNVFALNLCTCVKRLQGFSVFSTKSAEHAHGRFLTHCAAFKLTRKQMLHTHVEFQYMFQNNYQI